MRKLLLPFLATVAFSPAAQSQVITVGPNVNVSKLLGSQSETAIALSRTDSNLIALASNSGSGVFTAFTTDGGSNWGTGALVAPGSYDPWMGADRFGNIFFSYQVAGVTQIARSTTGGASYSSVVTVPGGNADHPEMAIGPGVVAGTDSIYLRDSVNNQSRVISATSSALGVSTGYSTQTGLATGNFGSTAVGPGGQTVFTQMDPCCGVGPTNMTLRHDADGTGPGGYVVKGTVTTQVGGFRSLPAQPNRDVDAQVALSYDFSGGAHNGDLYMVYTQAADAFTNDTNIVFRRSSDNGASFSSELRLNTDVGNHSQFFSRMAVDQKNGWLAAVWYDARNAPGNDLIELWGTVSFDGGLNWVPDFQISQGLSNGTLANIGNPNEFGDYIAMDFYDGKIVTAWADSSNSTLDNPNGTAGLDIYFSQILVSAVPEPATYALMGLGLLLVGARSRRRAASR